MSDLQEETVDGGARQQAAAAFTRAGLSCAFGPSFFLAHLGRFVRDHCPDPKEHLPTVHVHLVDGETLDVCHIIAVSPRWVMVAVRDAASHRDGMAGSSCRTRSSAVWASVPGKWRVPRLGSPRHSRRRLSRQKRRYERQWRRT